jgi:hypothetical protein
MRVVITGATGFIGKDLCQELAKNYEIAALSRNAEKARKSLGQLAAVVHWDGKSAAGLVSQVEGALAVINLAGENLGSGRWNQAKKERILHSRLDAIEAIAEAVKQVQKKPKVLIQASAIGYYGSRQDEPLDETSPPGEGFLANVCRSIENASHDIERLGVRCVIIRSGVVLGSQAGALPRLAKPFRFYLGGHLGSGKQWFSWISLDDEVAAIRFLMENENLRGAFNLTAPQPVKMRDLCETLGKVLHRPAWLAVPGFILRLALGQMADEMLLSGQKVLPERLLEAGFKFEYPTIENALSAIVR